MCVVLNANMYKGLQFLCQREAGKLLMLVGAAFVIVMVVQYLEIPSIGALTSLFLGNAGRNASIVDLDHQASNSIPSERGAMPPLDIALKPVKNGSFVKPDVAFVAPSVSPPAIAKPVSPSAISTSSLNGSSNTMDHVEIGLNKDGNSGLMLSKPDQASVSQSASPPVNATPVSPVISPSSLNVSSNTKDHAAIGFNKDANSGLLSKPDQASVPQSASPPVNATPVSLAISPSSLNISSSTKDHAAIGLSSKGVNSGLLLNNNSSSVTVNSSAHGASAKNHQKYKPPSKVVPISEMNIMLHQRYASSSSSMMPHWSSEVDKEMLHARSEIEKAAGVRERDDKELYPSLYRNVSRFKRSYELMEKLLKVYVYQEGEKPIFHEYILEGIYASEGWFMKLMENNQHFVTKDPSKAHLFYIPFSSRHLELKLYVRKSHSRENLVEYMKNFVDMLGVKYPYWNRTDGTDHFVAACHDWAPAETRGRMLKSIRALCNADLEVGFAIGKDVSLPETYVRSAQNPLKYLEPNLTSTSERHVLAFFAGNVHGYVRPILLSHWENKDPDMRITGPLPHVRGNRNYNELMKTSKFCVCPRGFEVNSPRIVESIFFECVPVIISDNFVPPFFEVLDWESFAVFVLEKDIPELKKILLAISDERYREMHKRVKMVQKHFLWHHQPVKYDLFHMVLHSVWYNRVFQMRT